MTNIILDVSLKKVRHSTISEYICQKSHLNKKEDTSRSGGGCLLACGSKSDAQIFLKEVLKGGEESRRAKIRSPAGATS